MKIMDIMEIPMNNSFRVTLNFLMSAADETIKKWYDLASDEEVAYAQELLYAYEMELMDEHMPHGKVLH